MQCYTEFSALHTVQTSRNVTCLTPKDVKSRFRISVLSTNRSGIKNTSNDINSIRLFCSGVPVSNRRRRACITNKPFSSEYPTSTHILVSTRWSYLSIDTLRITAVHADSAFQCSSASWQLCWQGGRVWYYSWECFVINLIFVIPQDHMPREVKTNNNK